MRQRTLVRRSLRFHWRAHLGTLLGAIVGSATLIGALVVGDSVRGSLREQALQRLGDIQYALVGGDRFFRQDCSWEISGELTRNKVFNPGQASSYFTAFRSAAASGKRGADLSARMGISTAIILPGLATRQDGSARANAVQVVSLGPGLDHFAPLRNLTNFGPDEVVLNESLAAQIRSQPGDTIVLRIRKPSALAREVTVSPQSDSTVALRLRVHSILPAKLLGNFSLLAGQAPPLNAFVRTDTLQNALDLKGRANVLLAEALERPEAPPRYKQVLQQFWAKVASFFGRHPAGSQVPTAPLSTEEALAHYAEALQQTWELEDAGLTFVPVPERKDIQLSSTRIFIDRPVITAVQAITRDTTNAAGILTYLVNQFRAGERMTSYSMVSAMGAPIVPPEMKDDEILINEWLADDLQIGPGAQLSLTYFQPDSAANLAEATNTFRVRAVVPLSGVYADRTLMPEFPGLAKAESTHDWDAGFPLVHKIRDKDDQYWKQYRGTPKAFITLAAGQRMWANRFGDLTAIRLATPPGLFPITQSRLVGRELMGHLKPESIGLAFQPVRAQALSGSSPATDFGGLFLGFSFFLILAALILMALLFQFGLEQRGSELGTLLALGFAPRQVRRLLLSEGAMISFLGGLLGVLGGLVYAKAMVYALTTIWRDAVGDSALQFHVTLTSLAVGVFASTIVGTVTIGLVLRKQARRPARELLSEEGGVPLPSATIKPWPRRKTTWIAAGSVLLALAIVGWTLWHGENNSPGAFFGAGTLLLVGELAAAAGLLAALDRMTTRAGRSLGSMGVRNCARRRTRSLACVALLACGSFLIVAVGANRLEAGRDASKRPGGTGGFRIYGESTLPVLRDLNSNAGREHYGLDEKSMTGVGVVPFRVRDGDDASCLNLGRAQSPRLLGVKPELLAERNAFSFAKVLRGLAAEQGWRLLKAGAEGARSGAEPDVIPAIGDAASIEWALRKKLGDTIEYKDEHGRVFKVRLVAGLANSILQGNLIIDEAAFVKRFPGESGYRMFLIDAASNSASTAETISPELSRALQNVGFAATPTLRRLATFNAVQNTYLGAFQVLGGLGLLVGSAGLGVVVLRNVLERRGELGLLQAVGFRRRSLQWLVLSEHGGLLMLGLLAGTVAALTAILPVLLAPGGRLHSTALTATVLGALISGLLWTWLATAFALRGRLLDALRNE